MSDTGFTGLEIAVIGMACRFPGANNVEEYWENLKNGVESVTFFTGEELEAAGTPAVMYNHPDYVPAMAILDDIESFDAGFFDYAPLEAGLMDPQMRLFHECAWSALEDAGVVPGEYDGLIGLYAGGYDSFHWKSMIMLSGKNQDTGVYEFEQLANKDYICSKVAYKLDLKGPVASVQTACSTSLVAIHMGCQALLSGESDVIMAGGVSIIPFHTGYVYVEGMIKSPDGHCRAFDEKARGFYAGNGGGAVVLKRYEDAVNDHDNIYAIIKGSAMNNDGQQKIGFTAPSVEAQSEVIKDALRTAQVDVETIGFIEAHGTGTNLGDPVEFEALSIAYQSDQRGFCGIGSAKTNFGHLDAAAGVAGFIKAVLTLKHQLIPPTLHFQSPNPKINLIDSPFYINADLNPWERSAFPRRAGVSSLGLGGTNVHVIVEETPGTGTPGAGKDQTGGGDTGEEKRESLIVISGRTTEVVENMSANLASHLEKHPGLPITGVAYTLQAGRKAFRFRRAFVCDSIAGAVEALKENMAGPVIENPVEPGNGEKRESVLVFSHTPEPATSAAWKQLYDALPFLQETVDHCFNLLKPITGYHMKRRLFDQNARLTPDLLTIASVVFQYSLARAVQQLGIKINVTAGHGTGEIAAAHFAGIISLEEMLQMAFAVGQIIKQAAGTQDGSFNIPDGIADIFKRKLRQIKFQAPQVSFLSGVTGQIEQSGTVDRVDYWAGLGALLAGKEFDNGLTQLTDQREFLLITVGTGALPPFPGHSPRIVSIVSQPFEDETPRAYYSFLQTLGHLWRSGYNLNWQVLNRGQAFCKVSLPPYAFEKHRFPVEGNPFQMMAQIAGRGPASMAIEKETDIGKWFYLPAWKRTQALAQVHGLIEPLAGEITQNGGTWLIFHDDSGLGEQIEQLLTSLDQPVIRVTPGSTYNRDSGGNYTIDPKEPEHYIQLVGELVKAKKFPRHIFHLWNLCRDSHTDIGIEHFYSYQYRGFYSLLLLASSIHSQGVNHDVQISVVTNNIQDVTGHEEICPELSTIMGAVKSIPQEFPYIVCRSIDVQLPALEKEWDKRVTHQLIAEFYEPHFEPVIAYRGNYRWIEDYDQINIPEATGKIPLFKQNGVYLITGGLGNIGHLLARYLVEQVDARVILISRSGVPNRDEWDQYLDNNPEDDRVSDKIRKLEQLDDIGATYTLKLADAGNLEQMERAVAEAEAEWGPLNGVFHAAGETDNSIVCTIDRLTEDVVKRQFQARIFGLLVLEEILREREPDFCVVVSSLVTVLGGIGFAAYGGAINFMDAVAHYGNREGRFPWISIGTAEWMFKEAPEHVIQSGLAGELLELSMTVPEGLETFRRVLSHCARGQVVVSTGDIYKRVDKWVKLKTLHPEKKDGDDKEVTLYPRPDLSTVYAAPGTEEQEKMVDIWQNFFAVAPIGIDDNFFELGGDSLKVITLVSKIHKEFHVRLTIESFFANPDIRRLISVVSRVDTSGQDRYTDIQPVEEKEYYPLSSAQKRVFFLQQMDLESTTYNSKFVQFTGGMLKRDRLEKTLRQLIGRHESMRTSFHMIDGVPVQTIHAGVDFVLEYNDVGEMATGLEDREKGWYTIVERIVDEFFRPFDLSEAPLFRSGLVRLPDGNHLWLWDLHHIVSDGASHALLTEDVFKLYSGQRLEPLRVQYKDFSQWQYNLYSGGRVESQLEFWLQLYADAANGDVPRLDYAVDLKRPPVFDFKGHNIDFRLGSENTEQLRAFVQKCGGTFYMNFLALLNTLFYKYTGQTDIIIGSAGAGRPHLDLQPIIGMFVNTLAMRNFPIGNKTYEEFLKEVIGSSIKALENQDVQFEELVEHLGVDRDPARSPLFDVLMVVQNYLPLDQNKGTGAGSNENNGDSKNDAQQPGSYISEMNIGNTTSKFDMTFYVYEETDDANIIVEYYTSIFKPGTIHRMTGHLKTLIRTINQNPNIRLDDIELISPDEKKKILDTFNDTRGDYPRDKTIHELFEHHVRNTPDRVALVGGVETLTYRALDEHSDRIAAYLHRLGQSYGGMTGQPVGLLVEKCTHMIAAILGILKAGAAYMPMGTSAPVQRIKTLIDDAQCRVIISQQAFVETLDQLQNDCPLLDTYLLLGAHHDHGEQELFNKQEKIPAPAVNGDSLAYIIYTSGSTGLPKGVMVPHRGVVRLVKETGFIDFSPHHRIIQTNVLEFDVSTFDIWGALLNGLGLYLVDKETLLSPPGLKQFLVKHRISIMWLTAALFNRMAQEDPFIFQPLTWLLAGGEALSPEHCNRVVDALPGLKFVNGYGPTENTTFSTTCLIEKTYDYNVPIGGPIANSTVYILDSRLRQQPIGVTGEIWTGGDGVARGYLNNPQLTAEKFVPVSIDGETPGILYRTGDLGRWLEDGRIEFLGRVDNQVKVRGFRIELDEIRIQLLQNQMVSDAVVIDRTGTDKTKYICAYIVPADGQDDNIGDNTANEKELDIDRLRADLSRFLPDYMIPAFFIPMEQIPVTPNGKVDRKALPEAGGTTDRQLTPPVGRFQEKMLDIWIDVLNREKVDGQLPFGVDDKFFDLGGHSLTATVLAARIHKEFNVKIPLAEIFRGKTARALAQFVENAGEEGYVSISPGELREYYPLTSAQERIYFIQQMDGSGVGYNIPMVVPIGNQVDPEHLEHTFKQLIARHESLRTSFFMLGEEPVQRVHPIDEIQFRVEELTHDSPGDFLVHRDFIRPFDLSRAPLIRAGYTRLPGGMFLLLVDMHHIAADGTSHTILTEDFAALARGETLEPLPIQYKDFALWQERLVRDGGIKEQVDYWTRLYQDTGALPRLPLPTDFKRPDVFTFSGSNHRFTLEHEDAARFRNLGSRSGATLYINFLAALNALFYKYTGQTDIIVGTGSAGRPHDDLHRIIGMFINTLAMRNRPQGNKRYLDFLKEVSRNSVEAFENQDVRLEELMETLDIERDTSRNPLFDVLMIVQNYRKPGESGQNRPAAASETRPASNDISGLSGVEFKNTVAKFDLTFYVYEYERDIHIDIEFYTAVFREETVARMASHLARLIKIVGRDPGFKLKDIDILSAQERKQVLETFNHTVTDYPRDKSITRLFLEDAEKVPGTVAAVEVDGNRNLQVSYSQLRGQALDIASGLTLNGVGSGSIVGIMMDRSIDMLAGILGILFAGAAYLPIEQGNPPERIRYMLEDSSAPIMIVEPRDQAEMSSGVLTAVTIADLTGNKSGDNRAPSGKPFAHSSTVLHKMENITPGDLVYIMYTSGSTGRPKGVMIEHRGVVRLVKNTDYDDIEPRSKIMQSGAIQFDASTFEIWGSLLNQSTLVLAAKEDIIIAERLGQIVNTHLVDTMLLTTPLFHRHIDSDPRVFAPLRTLLIGGDTLSPLHIKRVRELFPGLTVINGYGPTENTTFSTTFTIDADYENIPIGKPIANSRAYIFNPDFQLLPIGVAGELWVSGDGIARGYLNNPQLTAERFVIAQGSEPGFPGNDTGNETLYRTGDRARWLTGGNIEFLGRIDLQVKIRGFRVEPGEIEYYIVNTGLVNQAVVIPAENNSELRAYAVPSGPLEEPGEPGHSLLISRLKELLAGQLPAFMIPSRFMVLDTIPLTTNGKVDTRALPEPGAVIPGHVIAPRGHIEESLVNITADVLNIEENTIGIDHDFFELGGHSLKAAVLVSRVHKELNVRIPLVELFKNPTVRGIARYISGKGVGTGQYTDILPVEKREYYAMSSAQRRIYFTQQMNPLSIAYHMPQVVPLSYDTDIKNIAAVFTRLIHRHEALRTSFNQINGEPVQRVHDRVEFQVEVISNESEKVDYSRFIRPFRLDQAPLLRAGILTGAAGTQALIVDMHHIISDGTSQSVLVNDFLALARDAELPPLNIQYKDYSIWQNRSLLSGENAGQSNYWLELYADAPGIPRIDLPLDAPRPPVFTFSGQTLTYFIQSQIARPFIDPGNKRKATLFMSFLAAIDVLLYRITGQDDIIIGCGTAGRPHADLQKVIGMFINILPMRNQILGNMTYEKLLETVSENTLRSFENQDMQFDMLVEQLDIKRDPSRNPLFDISLVVQNFADTTNITGPRPGESGKSLPSPVKSAKYDLTFSVLQLAEEIRIDVEYYNEIFTPQSIQRLVHHLQKIMEAVGREPGIVIDDIPLIGEEEKRQILEEFNNTAADYPSDKTMHQLIAEQANQYPEKTALVSQETGDTLTFGQLHQQALAAASFLTQKGVQPETIVGIMMKRSIELITGIAGILYAGAAYMPIDPEYPAERIQYMLTDSAAPIVLTDKASIESVDIKQENIEIIETSSISKIGDRQEEELAHSSKLIAHRGKEIDAFPTSYELPATSLSLAYVIYTSGTTGRPKGTLVQHQSLVNMCQWHVDYYSFSPDDRTTQYAGIGFDAAVWEIFVPLFRGMEMHILGSDIRLDIAGLKEYYNSAKITAGFLPTRFCRQFMEDDTPVPSLRLIITGGEKLDGFVQRDYKVYNNYGPTENTVVATAYPVEQLEHNIPIGRPVSNNIILILDRTGTQLQPAGIPGELCIGGDSLARGYLNNPELTAGRFFATDLHRLRTQTYTDGFVQKDHFALSTEHLALYKTGDLARWRPDGNIEYLGRIDHQVKIRGFRIELAEVEQVLLESGFVKDVVVVPLDDYQDLCAYVVTSGEVGDREELAVQLKTGLGKQLPFFMVPGNIVVLDEIPLTFSGKVNRAALPEPERAGDKETTAPRDELEKQLAGIWAGILGIDESDVGIDDDFFHLGGHSLKATLAVNLIYKETGVRVPIADFFSASSLQRLANIIRQTPGQGFMDIIPVPQQEFYPISFNQKRLWIIQQHDLENNAFNMPDFMALPGIDGNPPDETVVRKAVNLLALKHESLRTGFKEIDGNAVQYILKEWDIPVEVEDVTALIPDRKQDRLTRLMDRFYTAPFRLDEPPLFRIMLIKHEPLHWIMAYNMHHIVSDGWSLSILQRDFFDIYGGLLTGRDMENEVSGNLPGLTYKDFASWHNRQLADTGQGEKSHAFWAGFFEKELPLLRFPGDSDGYNKPKKLANYRIVLSQGVHESLKKLTREHKVTLFSVMYTVYNYFLSVICGERTVVSSILNAGRDHPSLGDVVGFFVNPVLFRSRIDHDAVFIDLAREVQANVHQCFRHQHYPLELVLDEIGQTYPEVTAAFNMLNFAGGNPGDLEDFEAVHSTDIAVQAAKYDLEPAISEYRNGIEISAGYNKNLITPANIEVIMNRYRSMVEFFAANPGKKLSEYKETRKRKSFKKKSK